MKRLACTVLLFALFSPLGCGSSSKPAPKNDAEQQAAIEAEDAAVQAAESAQ